MSQPDPAAVALSSVDPETADARVSARLDAAFAEHVEGRRPLRFTWSVDVAGVFRVEDELLRLLGWRGPALSGRSWREVAGLLGLPSGTPPPGAPGSIEDGVMVDWPLDGGTNTLPVLLCGISAATEASAAAAYRGYGQCRAREQITAAIAARRADGQAGSAGQPAGATQVFVDGSAPDAFAHAPTPSARNVVRFPSGGAVEARQLVLNTSELNAFDEIARELGERLGASGGAWQNSPAPGAPAPDVANAAACEQARPDAPPALSEFECALLDRLPLGLAVLAGDQLLFANRTLLNWTGFSASSDIPHGGLSALLSAPAGPETARAGDASRRPAMLIGAGGAPRPVEAHLHVLPRAGETVLLLTATLREPAAPEATNPTDPEPTTPSVSPQAAQVPAPELQALALNDLARAAVAGAQERAGLRRVILRAWYGSALPAIAGADGGTERLIADLLSARLDRCSPGDHIIVTTAVADATAPVLRIRDAAAEPVNALPARPFASAPIEAALRLIGARMQVRAAPGAGTLTEITFRPYPAGSA